MHGIKLDKLVINIGTGTDTQTQENAKKLLELITDRKPADEISKRRIPGFKITKGEKIGTFVTLRGNAARDMAVKLLSAADNTLKKKAVTDNSISFGIREYIDISGVKYDPKIGMLGMNVNLSFKRAGTRVETRKRRSSEVPRRHKIIKSEELWDYAKKEFKVSEYEG